MPYTIMRCYYLLSWFLEPPSVPSGQSRPHRLTATSFVSELDQSLIRADGFESTSWYHEETAQLLEPLVDDNTIRETTQETVVHRVCEFGPHDSPAERRSVTERVLTSEGPDLDSQQTKYLDAHIERGLGVQAAFVDQWSAESIRREPPVRLRVGETTIIGKIDLLLVTDDTYHILDYKTNRVTNPERDIANLCRHYRPQPETYAAALQRDDPTRSVSAILHFTAADTARQLKIDAASPPIGRLN